MEKTAIYEACARAAHEMNRIYSLAIEDPVQVPWEEAPDWQKASCLMGVTGVLEKGNTPEMSHASWLKVKEQEGWSYGPVKDIEKKQHPCFCPYQTLPEAQRAKDELFVITVQNMAAVLGLRPTTVFL